MHRLTWLATLLLAYSAHAGSIEQLFGAGVLDFKWGTTLAEVQAKYPDGFTWETAKIYDTDFIFTARVDSQLFGLESRDLPVHFQFDESEKLITVSLYFPYDHKDEVFYQIAQTLGQNYQVTSTKISSLASWPSEAQVRVVLDIGHSEPYKWAVLRIYRDDSYAR